MQKRESQSYVEGSLEAVELKAHQEMRSAGLTPTLNADLSDEECRHIDATCPHGVVLWSAILYKEEDRKDFWYWPENEWGETHCHACEPH